MQGIVPIAYTLFAVALGVFAGTFLNRVLPAMAVTLGGFLAIRVAIAGLARPRYMTAQTRTYLESFSTDDGGGTAAPAPAPTGEAHGVGDWTLAREFRDANGLVSNDEFADVNAYTWELFHPADRFWPFQLIESGIFVGLALILFALALRRVQRIA
jgi:hypothetical protein